MVNDRLAGVQQMRGAFQQGVLGDVTQAKMAQAQAVLVVLQVGEAVLLQQLLLIKVVVPTELIILKMED